MAERSDLRLHVLAALVNGPIRVSVLARQLSRKDRAVSITLGRLEAEGFAYRLARGVWDATPEGRRYAKGWAERLAGQRP